MSATFLTPLWMATDALVAARELDPGVVAVDATVEMGGWVEHVTACVPDTQGRVLALHITGVSHVTDVETAVHVIGSIVERALKP